MSLARDQAPEAWREGPQDDLVLAVALAAWLGLLEIDRTKPTFQFGGRDRRLTDVHGEVVRAILT